MIRGIGGADYSYQYRLQPIVLIIGPITRMVYVSVQLYYIVYTIRPSTLECKGDTY